jgi:hypothetical protein
MSAVLRSLSKALCLLSEVLFSKSKDRCQMSEVAFQRTADLFVVEEVEALLAEVGASRSTRASLPSTALRLEGDDVLVEAEGHRPRTADRLASTSSLRVGLSNRRLVAVALAEANVDALAPLSTKVA